jgi:hypothetical protein
VWVKELGRDPIKLTFEGTDNDHPSWRPDGTALTFYSARGSSADLWTKRADGSAQAVLEQDEELPLSEPLWSSNGEWFLYRVGRLSAADIFARRADRSAPVPIVATQWSEVSATLSPDGRWLAYASDERGRYEVYVVPFPNAGDAKWLVSTGGEGGTEPLWSRGGSEIFYRNGRDEMVAVPVETDPTFAPRLPTVLFSAAPYRQNVNRRQYDVTPDDQRFVMIRAASSLDPPDLILVQDFAEELRDRVPN